MSILFVFLDLFCQFPRNERANALLSFNFNCFQVKTVFLCLPYNKVFNMLINRFLLFLKLISSTLHRTHTPFFPLICLRGATKLEINERDQHIPPFRRVEAFSVTFPCLSFFSLLPCIANTDGQTLKSNY